MFTFSDNKNIINKYMMESDEIKIIKTNHPTKKTKPRKKKEEKTKPIIKIVNEHKIVSFD
jgi:DNA repair protein RadC